MPDDPAIDPAGGGPALFRVVRFWSRRGPARVAADLTSELQDIQVLEAVHTAGAAASVADVAHQLGIDRSGASRFVTDAVTRGYLTRGAAPDDARRAVLSITEAGATLLDAAHVWQSRVFADLTASWPAHEATAFAAHLRRLADELNAQ